jgi:hypothetical protein
LGKRKSNLKKRKEIHQILVKKYLKNILSVLNTPRQSVEVAVNILESSLEVNFLAASIWKPEPSHPQTSGLWP